MVVLTQRVIASDFRACMIALVLQGPMQNGEAIDGSDLDAAVKEWV